MIFSKEQVQWRAIQDLGDDVAKMQDYRQLMSLIKERWGITGQLAYIHPRKLLGLDSLSPTGGVNLKFNRFTGEWKDEFISVKTSELAIVAQ
jgi:hypothetical protein